MSAKYAPNRRPGVASSPTCEFWTLVRQIEHHRVPGATDEPQDGHSSTAMGASGSGRTGDVAWLEAPSSHSPQYRHFLAVGWISSPQYGHVFMKLSSAEIRKLERMLLPCRTDTLEGISLLRWSWMRSRVAPESWSHTRPCGPAAGNEPCLSFSSLEPGADHHYPHEITCRAREVPHPVSPSPSSNVLIRSKIPSITWVLPANSASGPPWCRLVKGSS